MKIASKGEEIDCYTAGTSNGRRVVIMLEEAGLPYYPIWIDISRGQHRTPEFLAVNPIGVIPAIVDHGEKMARPITLTQSAAILMYLAEKSGRFMPSGVERYQALKWVMFGVSDLACASASEFQLSMIKEDATSARSHFKARIHRYLTVMEKQLAGQRYLLNEFSIADICLYPNVDFRPSTEVLVQSPDAFPNVLRWLKMMSEREAVKRSNAICPVPGSFPAASSTNLI